MDFKKKLKQRFYIAAAYIILGLVLIFVDIASNFENYFFSSFGIALTCMGILRLLHYRKITRNDQTMRKQELAESDERIRMISERAKSWVFSFSIIISGILVIVLNILGYHDAALPFSWFVCGMVTLYWIFWNILRKKY